MSEKYERICGEIYALKSLLADTDYVCLKYAEGALTENEFAKVKANRAEWREKINALETERDAILSTEPDVPQG
jgi:hypothetical protein